MNPVDIPPPSFCEWPVQSPYFGVEARSCGRAGHGRNVRLCWQHREAINAEVIGAMYEHPDARTSELIADWIRSVAPSEYDTEERAAERERARRFAVRALESLATYYGAQTDKMPEHIARGLDHYIEALVAERLQQTWGAA